MAKKFKLRLRKKSASGDAASASIDKQYNAAQKRQDQRYAADLEKERAIREGNAAAAKRDLPQGKLDGQGGNKTTQTYAIGRGTAGQSMAKAGEENLASRKASGEYNAAPPVKGGTKKQMRKTKLRIRKNSASPQAKEAARRAL